MSTHPAERGGLSPVVAVLAWLWVVVPFAWGLYFLVARIPALFSG
jgi:hypothetical protein